MPSAGMLPPLPNGLPPPPVTQQDLIPQAQVGATTAPVATSVGGGVTMPVTVTPGMPPPPGGASSPMAPMGISLDLKAAASNATAQAPQESRKKQLKGGLMLVFDSGEGDNEMSMEELRASLPRYQAMVSRSNVSKAVTNLPCLA